MMSENTGLSAGDVIALTGNRNNDGMWGDGGWLWAIIALAILGGGWGNGFGFGGGFGCGGFGGAYGFPGYGYGGAPVIINSGNDGNCGHGACATQEDIRNAVDQQTLISKLDQQTYGLADSTYALNNAITTGFAGVQQTLCQGFNGINTGLLQNSYNTQAGFNSLSHQLSDCCCTTQRGLDSINYNIATTACATNTAINDAARTITENANSNTRAILDFIVKDKIEGLRDENLALKFKASQSEQNNFIAANQEAQTATLIRRLGLEPAQGCYLVNPPTPIQFPVNSCNTFAGYNQGCGCGCGC